MPDRYPLKTKLRAHKMYCEGMTIAEISRELEIGMRTMHRWGIHKPGYDPGKDKNITYHIKLKSKAKLLYQSGLNAVEINKELGVGIQTLRQWQRAGNWTEGTAHDVAEIAVSQRINTLALMNDKTPEQLQELIALCSSLGRMNLKQATALRIKAEAVAIEKGNPVYHTIYGNGDRPEARLITAKEPPRKNKIKVPKNDISHVTAELLDAVREKLFFGYQKLWYERRYDKATQRNRFLLKARQIGATYYFAFEALDNAIRTGDNQIFLSASRDQAEVFKAYIIAFAIEHLETELKGAGVITLSNGAELRFLSTNSNTAQSYHGHLYIDEVFWIPFYKRLQKVASGMASHKRWTRTYISTPSAISHEAYATWSGEVYNKHKAEEDRAPFDVSHAALKDGWLGPDKIWRHMVTVEDAEAQGCNLFDIADLRLEYSVDDFNNLFMCKFIDDSQSVFSLAKLLECIAVKDEWWDYREENERPFGNRPVALGYDPSRTRDNSSLALLAVPLSASEKWRALRIKSYHGKNFQYQAARIKEERDRHNVVHIGIDTTGIGHGVYELVQDWYPLATPIHYSLEMKTQLVLKALDLINNGRFQYLSGDHEITRAFLMITQTTTSSGQLTYSSSRSVESGHADVAWSLMHAFIYEPLNNNSRKTTATFSN